MRFTVHLCDKVSGVREFCICLKASFAKVAGRVKIDGTRPKFTSTEQAEALHQTRAAYYALAKIHISTDEGTPETVVEEILGVVRNS